MFHLCGREADVVSVVLATVQGLDSAADSRVGVPVLKFRFSVCCMRITLVALCRLGSCADCSTVNVAMVVAVIAFVFATNLLLRNLSMPKVRHITSWCVLASLSYYSAPDLVRKYAGRQPNPS